MDSLARAKPVTAGSHFFSLFIGTLTWIAFWFADAVGKGNPDAVFLLIATPVFLIQNFLFGLVPFFLLRRSAPMEGVYRFVFFIAIFAPAVCLSCLAGSHWIDGFSDYSPYFPSPKPAFVDRFGKALSEHWPTILAITILGGLVCWGFDRKSLLASDIRRVRVKARHLLAASLLTPVIAIVIVLTCNQYVVRYRAQSAAGDRPYCILVPSASSVFGYQVATRTSQLSIFNMRANYTLTTGSMGGFYATNHAILVLDNPTEYKSWSYRAENYVRDHPRGSFNWNDCAPRRNFVETLN